MPSCDRTFKRGRLSRFRRWMSDGNSRQRDVRHPRASAMLEQLEDRTVPATFTVDIALDEVDGNTSAGNLSLREAIEASNLAVGADVIQFSTALNGQTITLGGTQLEITDDVTINGLGAESLSISGNGQSRIFFVDDDSDATNLDVAINGLTLRDGFTEFFDFPDERGAAILSRENLELKDAILTQNVAEEGGALAVETEGATTTIENTSFTQNTAQANFGTGGGIYISETGGGTVSIDTATISNNTAADDGGGIYVVVEGSGGNLSITNTTISGNDGGSWGGGIYVGLDSSATASLDGVTISNNTIPDVLSFGGGLYASLDGQSFLTIQNTTVTDNEVMGGGGGLYLQTWGNSTVEVLDSLVQGNETQRSLADGGGIVASASFGGDIVIRRTTIDDNKSHSGGTGGGLAVDAGTDSTIIVDSSTISNNEGGSFFGGGGVYARTLGTGLITVTNSTISGNRSDGSGGGIHISGNMVLENSTVFDNESDVDKTSVFGSGGGVYVFVGSTLSLVSSVIANNRDEATAFPAPQVSGNFDASYSWIEDGTGAEITGFNNRVGSTALPLDPLLGALADNGGPTLTHLPLNGSPLVDQGINQSDLSLEQRGLVRTIDLGNIGNPSGGDGTDIGAVEVDSGTPPEGGDDDQEKTSTLGLYFPNDSFVFHEDASLAAGLTETIDASAGLTQSVTANLDVDGTIIFDGGGLGATFSGEVTGSGTIRSFNSRDRILLGGSISPDGSQGSLRLQAPTVTFASGSELVAEYSPFGSDTIDVDGQVIIEQGATLSLANVNATDFNVNSHIILVDNDGTDAIIGEFSGAAAGTEIMIGGARLQFRYDLGDGNDFGLTVLSFSKGGGVQFAGATSHGFIFRDGQWIFADALGASFRSDVYTIQGWGTTGDQTLVLDDGRGLIYRPTTGQIFVAQRAFGANFDPRFYSTFGTGLLGMELAFNDWNQDGVSTIALVNPLTGYVFFDANADFQINLIQGSPDYSFQVGAEGMQLESYDLGDGRLGTALYLNGLVQIFDAPFVPGLNTFAPAFTYVFGNGNADQFSIADTNGDGLAQEAIVSRFADHSGALSPQGGTFFNNLFGVPDDAFRAIRPRIIDIIFGGF
ncbi:hypothetical protein Pan216_14340 [Planctomycetes bacterium Pan216]|uniref:Uncharacterized protein n=1 Tax=Kolteria novifilia TaxID=2527975 RepID=A0A518B0V2_9BACT|nr:hypothetical protein Pan216_14340 [Planctomycetes bacterium Pan216]